MLEPSYDKDVEAGLDLIENDPDKRKLWIEIVKTLDFILDHPDDERARRHAMRHPDGPIWRVPVYETGEDQDWNVLWSTDGVLARFLYVGPWPPVT